MKGSLTAVSPISTLARGDPYLVGPSPAYKQACPFLSAYIGRSASFHSIFTGVNKDTILRPGAAAKDAAYSLQDKSRHAVSGSQQSLNLRLTLCAGNAGLALLIGATGHGRSALPERRKPEGHRKAVATLPAPFVEACRRHRRKERRIRFRKAHSTSMTSRGRDR